MPHPVIENKQLFDFYPEIIENVQMSTVAYFAVPDDMREATLKAAADYARSAASKRGVSADVAEELSVRVRAALVGNIERFPGVAQRYRMKPIEMAYMLTTIVGSIIFEVEGQFSGEV
jgi:hypothetical protein